MNPNALHEIVEEFRRTRPDAGSDDAALLLVALFVEDVFKLCLSDAEISEANLGSHEAIEKFIRKKLEGE